MEKDPMKYVVTIDYYDDLRASSTFTDPSPSMDLIKEFFIEANTDDLARETVEQIRSDARENRPQYLTIVVESIICEDGREIQPIRCA